MKKLIALTAVSASMMAGADETRFEHTAPVEREGMMQYRFTTSDGLPYEVGYRLEGNTLHFPQGGTHELVEVSEEDAEALLRETYGLYGDRDALVRTRMWDGDF